MPITDKAELFNHEHMVEEITLLNGKTVLMRALTVTQSEEVQEMAQALSDEEISPNMYALCGFVLSLVHPETQEPLLTVDDIPTLEQNLGFGNFQRLVLAFNRLNGFEGAEEPDPVKKPSSSLGDTGLSATDLQQSVDDIHAMLHDDLPRETPSDGPPISYAKTSRPTIGQPS